LLRNYLLALKELIEKKQLSIKMFYQSVSQSALSDLLVLE